MNNDKPKLTPREVELIQCVCDDLSAKQIADRLDLSKRYVETKLGRIRKKINCATSIGIVVYAFKNKIAK